MRDLKSQVSDPSSWERNDRDQKKGPTAQVASKKKQGRRRGIATKMGKRNKNPHLSYGETGKSHKQKEDDLQGGEQGHSPSPSVGNKKAKKLPVAGRP